MIGDGETANVRGGAVWQKGKGKVETVNLTLELGYLLLTLDGLEGGGRQVGKWVWSLTRRRGLARQFGDGLQQGIDITKENRREGGGEAPLLGTLPP